MAEATPASSVRAPTARCWRLGTTMPRQKNSAIKPGRYSTGRSAPPATSSSPQAQPTAEAAKPASTTRVVLKLRRASQPLTQAPAASVLAVTANRAAYVPGENFILAMITTGEPAM